MALTVPQGFRVANTNPIDDRILYSTVSEALAAVGNPRRYNGLAIWITSEKKMYRFVGGIANENFVPELAVSEFLNTLIDQIFESETIVEKLVEALFDSDAFKEKMADYWSKEELRVLTPTALAEAGTLPDGTVVMVKEV